MLAKYGLQKFPLYKEGRSFPICRMRPGQKITRCFPSEKVENVFASRALHRSKSIFLDARNLNQTTAPGSKLIQGSVRPISEAYSI